VGVRNERRNLGKLVLALAAVLLAGACARNGASSAQTSPSLAVRSIGVGSSPATVIVSQDSSEAFVSYGSTNTVSVIDLTSDKVIRTLHLKGQVSDMALSPNGHWLYVAMKYNASATFDMQMIDTKTDSISLLMPLSGSAQTVSVSPNGQDAYVTLITGATTTQEELETIDLASRSVVDTVTLPGDLVLQRSEVAPDGRYLYLMSQAYSTANAKGQENVDGQLIVIDTVQQRIVGTIDAGLNSGCGLAVAPDGTEVVESFCATEARNSEPLGVRVYSTATDKLLAAIPIKYGVAGLTFSQNGRVLYAATTAGAIDLIDARSNKITSPISVPEASALGSPLGPIALSPNGRFLCAGTSQLAPYELLVVPLSRN
jgi:VCBS repeat-containing protein